MNEFFYWAKWEVVCACVFAFSCLSVAIVNISMAHKRTVKSHAETLDRLIDVIHNVVQQNMTLNKENKELRKGSVITINPDYKHLLNEQKA